MARTTDNEELIATPEERPLFKQKISRYKKVFIYVRRVVERTISCNVNNAAKVITYYWLLSFFPIVIFVGNVIPFLHLDAKVIMTYLEMAFPGQIMPLIRPIVSSLLHKSSSGLLSFGVIATLWAGSRGTNAIRNSMNDAYQIDSSNIYSNVPLQNAIVRRIFSFLMTFIFIIALLAIVVVFTFGQQFLEWLIPTFQLSDTILDVFLTWKWPVIVGVIVLAIMFLQYVLPSARLKLWTILPGTIFTSGTWILLTQGFSLYVRYFARSFNSYGTIGTLIVALLWLNFAATLLMIGSVVNAVFNESWHGDELIFSNRFTRLLKR
ncbi:YihY/virulence factor BrkB family protein [Lapidilactobacillus bayanensis]|uniref:YihY/virulence factor BrkB family protein n=1 Tax=Lapidilactobacillus bayanensis TaxID=2485998 RepID=UPI0013DE2C7A|nr:YihY/virulence factor BrkB family protein [Lapidilactobacillus bayanensis]